MAYTTPAQVRAYQDITSGTDDALLKTLIDAAQLVIDNRTHRTFEASADEEATRYFDYSAKYVDGSWLWLDGEICQITTVTNGDNNEVLSTEYTTIPRNKTPYNRLRILSNSGKTWTYTDEWMDAISIAGRWAYSITAPDAIAQACTELAAFLYRKRDQSFVDLTAIEAGVVVRPVGLPATVVQVLEDYTRL